MLQIHHEITLGASTLTTKQGCCLVELRAVASLQVPVNQCRIVLGNPGELAVKPSDPVTVKLGYGNTTSVVFTGIVGSAEWSMDKLTVYAVGLFRALTLARFNLFYEKPNAGEIVKDIVQNRLKLRVNKIEDGLKFAVYALGDRTSVYDHLTALAAQCGFNFYANTEDQVVFSAYKATTTHELTYGQQILQATLDQSAPSVTGIEIYGESPSSEGQGDQAYAWLTKKEIKGTAGTRSGVLLRLDDPTARTQDVAGKIAKAILEQRRQKQRGQLTVLGDPKLKLGDSIKVAQMPISQQNGTFRITGVSHRVNRRHGFYTLIHWEET